MNKIDDIKNQLNNNDDVVVRQLVANGKNISLVFLKSTTDKMLFVQSVLSPILSFDGEITLEKLEKNILSATEVEKIEENYVENIIKNKVVLFIDGEEGALSIDLELLPARQPNEPPTSPTIQGPREGFTESIKINLALIRKQIPSKHLAIQNYFVGEITHTKVSLVFLDNIADKNIVKKISKKLQSINTDGIIDSHYLIEYLSERPNSIFEQCGTNEKPDIVTAKLLEGRIAIFVDGTPIVLTIPYMFIEDLQNSNDYYTNSHYATFIRYIRSLGIILATVIPGVYLSFRLYHYRIVPLKYIITINATTQNLPFTPIIEMLFILVLFQILYEVSLRLPRYLGIATSIVGALVLGDTGVQAGLISPPGIIVIALSLISVYTIPTQAPQLTLLRFVFLLIGGTLGLLGIVGAMVYFVSYMSSLNEYDTPFLSPYAPRVKEDLKDALHRTPVEKMKKRPKSIKNTDKIRGIQNERWNNYQTNGLFLCNFNACPKTCHTSISFVWICRNKWTYCCTNFIFVWFFGIVFNFKTKK